MNLLKPLAAALALSGLSLAQAASVTVTVDGTADLYNATGPTYDGTAPVAIDVTGLSSITFSVSAGYTVTVNGGGNYNDADGVGAASPETNTGTPSISGIAAPGAGYVAGAFLSGGSSSSAPAALDFTATGLGTSFASLSPLLGQAFFIGDGLTGDGTGAVQTFYVPTGATTLYLGLTDACSYYGGPSCFGDNGGSFSVTTNGASAMPPVPAVPEPSTWALMFGGMGVVGWSVRRRRASH